MNKIGLIIRREYLNRVKNKTFLVLTFLAPLFYGILLVLPLLTANLGKETKYVELRDESGLFAGQLKANGTIAFRPATQSLPELQKSLSKEKGPDYVLYIPKGFNIYHPAGITMFSKKNVASSFKGYIDSLLASRVTELKMQDMQVQHSTLDSLHTVVDVQLQTITERGLQASSSTASTIAAIGGGFLIYIFIFLYGGLVLRGVQEEKQNRVVEVVISSVRPFQLMMGKIIGIALVGLTQFLIWVFLTVFITTVAAAFFGAVAAGPELQAVPHQVQIDASRNVFDHAMAAFNTLNIPLLIAMFIFYFIGGYLLYSSLFAAFAAAVDSQTDIYQFMFPMSLPIIFSITLIPTIIDNPDSTLATWLSIIPFTSPVIMMARLPFIDPGWQLLLSVVLLIGGFIFTTWLAARIYRVGILLYGKKITYREIMRWLFYRG